MSDDKEIRELLARYALTLDVDDFDGCLELFTDDGEFLVYGKTWAGEGIRDMFTRAPRRSARRDRDGTDPDVVHRVINP